MFVLPPALPDRLADYAPGRVVEVEPQVWPIDEVLDRIGLTSTIPRYALEVLTARIDIDPDRVRWLATGSSTRPLRNRHVHVVHHRARLHIVDGHHALAAHLAVGSDRIPVRLVTPSRVHDPEQEGLAGNAGAA